MRRRVRIAVLAISLMAAVLLIPATQPVHAASVGKPVIKSMSTDRTIVTIKFKAAKKAKKYKVQWKYSASPSYVSYKTAKTIKAKKGQKTYTVKLKLYSNDSFRIRIAAVGAKNKKAFSKTKKLDIGPCDHVYEKTVLTQGSCTQEGRIRYTCKYCWDYYTETIPAGHKYEKTVLSESTCNERGLVRYTCSVCGDTYDEEQARLKHDWQTIVHPPTQEYMGYTEKHCPKCGRSTYGDSTIYPLVIEIPDEETIRAKLEKIKEQYPEGTHWGHDTFYTSKYPRVGLGGKDGEHVRTAACGGFADMVSEELYAYLPDREIPLSEVRIGDRIRTMYTYNGVTDSHVGIVYKIDKEENMLYCCGGNSGGEVYWEGQLGMPLDTILSWTEQDNKESWEKYGSTMRAYTCRPIGY